MTFLIIFAVFAGIAMILIAAKMNKGNRQAQWHADSHNNDKDHTPIKARPILMVNEIPLFLKLRKALPDYIVLTQVALSAILSSSGQVTRNKLNRYRADFVILDKDFRVLAIIELENPSQNAVEIKKQDRNAMCKEANYHVIHYAHTPDIEQIQRDFSNIGLPRQTEKLSKSTLPSKQTVLSEENFFDHDF